jgi:hypothetical protein
MPMYPQVVTWFLVLSVVMSLIEHQVHARLMQLQPKLFWSIRDFCGLR